MINTKRLITVTFALTAISGLSVGDWHGFRGLEKEGRCDSAAGPLNWSSSQNVVWKTAIPGRGHSSPILSGEAIYLTTTYEAAPFSQSIWVYTILALTVLFTMTGISLAMQNLRARQRKIEKAWQHVRFFLFTQILVGVVVVVLFGRHLLSLDDDTTRSWLASTMVVLSCLTLGSLLVPLRSRQHLVAGSLFLLFTVPAFITIKDQEARFAFGSLRSMFTMTVAISPSVLGLTLLAACLYSRKRHSEMVQIQNSADSNHPVMWHFILTWIIGFATALAPFIFLIYRAADYQIPDEYIWDHRIRPVISWWCIGLYVVLVVITIAGCYWKAIRGNVTNRPLLQGAFFVAALFLGTAFFVRMNSPEKPRQFIRAVVCLDRDSGEILWTCEGLVGQKGERSRTVTHAAATPVTGGQHIYGYFGEDGLMCVDPEGKLLWKKTESMFVGKYGVATSPIAKDNVLVIVSDVGKSADLGSTIVAFDCISGKVLWKKERESHQEHATYSTPLVKEINEEQVVIVHGWYNIKGYHLKNGQELWSYPMAHEGDHLVASLVSDFDHLFVLGARELRALDLSKLGSGNDPLVWSKPIIGEKSSTPIVVDGLMFLITEAGMLFCLEARTGEILYKQRLIGRYYSSVVTIGSRVLFTNESGQTTIAAADKEYRQLAMNTLNESVYATFAPVANQLFIRTNRYLYCIKDKQ